ncbi:MAG: sporulation protein YqfD [Peptococcaceae bacterium]|nr:sporulation protein YqfD [Peptococcaceae bacterium]
MRLASLSDKLFGALTVTASGRELERFFNTAYKQGIVMWTVRRLNPAKISFMIRPAAFAALRPLVRGTGIRLQIERKTGLPFIWSRLSRRKGILIGVLLCGLIIYTLSSFIWFVGVSGNKKLSQQQILQVAESLGVKPGVWRKEVDTTQLARELKEKIPQTAWVGVTLNGTRVNIQIVEKKERPAPPPGKGNLIAAKSGLITDVLVIKGVPQVVEGQTVKRGQALIAAEQNPAAQGFVRARVWYTGVGSAKLVDEGVRPTGKVSASLRIKIGTKVIILTGKNSPYQLYSEQSTVKALPKWRNIQLPVELVTVHYQEMTHYKKVMSKEEATKAAEAKASSDLLAQVPAGVKVLARKTVVVKNSNINLATVHIELETLEEIAVHQAF